MLDFFKRNGDGFIFALLGGGWILYYTQYSGLGISPDSIHYLSTAEHIIKGKGFTQFDGQALIMFPFCYPLFLSIFSLLLGNSWLHFMPIINALLFATLIYFTGVLFAKENKYLKWILLAIVATSPALIEIYSMLWSESLFTILVLMFYGFGSRYCKNQNIQNLLLWAFITGIAFDTRFAGLSLVITGVIVIILDTQIALIQRIKNMLIYGTISIFFVVINLSRNYVVSGTLTGIRQKGITPLKTNLQYFGEVIHSWIPFFGAFKQVLWIIPVLFLFVIILLLGYHYWKQNKSAHLEKLIITFTLTYTILILATATISKYETLNSRFFSPMYVSFIYILIRLGKYLYAYFNKVYLQRIFKLVAGIGVLLILLNHVKITKQNFYEVEDWGIGGYSEPNWKESPLIQYLKTDSSMLHSQFPLFSNGSHIIYYFTKKELTIVPERTHIKKVQAMLNIPVIYLIWFNEEQNKEVLTLNELAQKRKMLKLKEFKDGAIYKLSQ